MNAPGSRPAGSHQAESGSQPAAPAGLARAVARGLVPGRVRVRRPAGCCSPWRSPPPCRPRGPRDHPGRDSAGDRRGGGGALVRGRRAGPAPAGVRRAGAAAGYRSTEGLGIMARARTTWKDPALWRDGASIIGLWVPLFILDTVVLTVWLTFLAGITLPIWYWAPRGTDMAGFSSPTPVHGVPFGYFPHGPHGPGGVGLFVDSVPSALLAAACFLVLFLLFNYVLVLTARAHARVALSLLGAPADPLARAKEVLAGPGPLGPLQRTTVTHSQP